MPCRDADRSLSFPLARSDTRVRTSLLGLIFLFPVQRMSRTFSQFCDCGKRYVGHSRPTSSPRDLSCVKGKAFRPKGYMQVAGDWQLKGMPLVRLRERGFPFSAQTRSAVPFLLFFSLGGEMMSGRTAQRVGSHELNCHHLLLRRTRKRCLADKWSLAPSLDQPASRSRWTALIRPLIDVSNHGPLQKAQAVTRQALGLVILLSLCQSTRQPESRKRRPRRRGPRPAHSTGLSPSLSIFLRVVVEVFSRWRRSAGQEHPVCIASAPCGSGDGVRLEPRSSSRF